MRQEIQHGTVDALVFVGEQDGIVERELKQRLTTVLNQYCDIRRAYLVRVAYSDAGIQHVALCLEGGDVDQLQIANSVAVIFRELAPQSASLDILWPNVRQLSEVKCVSRPFYEACDDV
jgi:hypothetical protein